MAGVLRGRVECYPDGRADVYPDQCPVENVHRTTTPRCFSIGRDGDARVCPYWQATTSPNNYAERVHPSTLKTRATALGAHMVSCQVICLRGRANRPEGC